jgi:hypothetical protein
LQRKTGTAKAETIAFLASTALFLTAIIGTSIFTGQIKGSFQFVGLAGGIVLCWAVFHKRSRIKKEEGTKGTVI